jgi:hypothetical protein
MRPTAWHPKASFTKKYDEPSVEDWVQIHLKNIREIFGEENVGIITFQELGEKSKFLGFNVEYYGNLRSKNTFEKMPVLVVLGHFFPPMPKSRIDKNGVKHKGLEEIIDEWFLRDTTTYKMIELKQEIFNRYGKTKRAKDWKEKHLGDSWPRRYADKRGSIKFTRGDGIKLRPAMTIQDYFDDEIYQAVHRNRGLQNKRIIFLYCWIPEKYLFHGGRRLYKIVKEFDFRKIKNNEEDDFFNSLKEQIGNRNLVIDILNDIDYSDKSSTQIASDRKLSRKNIYNRPDGSGGPAAQYINILRDGIYKKDVGKNRLKDDKYKI